MLAAELLASVLVLLLYLFVRVRREAGSQRAEAELYRDIFHQCPAMMILVDPATGAVVDANKPTRAFYGWAPDARPDIAVHTDDSAEILGSENPSGRDTAPLLQRHRAADGEFREVEIFGEFATIHGGDHLQLIVHDVTERRPMERTLLGLLAAMPDPLFLFDKGGKIILRARWQPPSAEVVPRVPLDARGAPIPPGGVHLGPPRTGRRLRTTRDGGDEFGNGGDDQKSRIPLATGRQGSRYGRPRALHRSGM